MDDKKRVERKRKKLSKKICLGKKGLLPLHSANEKAGGEKLVSEVGED